LKSLISIPRNLAPGVEITPLSRILAVLRTAALVMTSAV
jgi:hypothetical protein